MDILTREANNIVNAEGSVVARFEANNIILEDGAGGGASYSTEEKKIGKWIDGKSVYSRVIAGDVTLVSGQWRDFSYNFNIDKLINARVLAGVFIPAVHYFLDKSSSAIKINGTFWQNEVVADALYIEYTKEE